MPKDITIAKSAGFCFGVRRAIDTVYEQIKTEARVYTYGPIIHNQEVINDLAAKDVKIINSLDELEAIKMGTIVIRSHGVAKLVYEAIKRQQLKCIDATCPFVKKIHRIVEQASNEGRHIVIIGDEKHPEVEGIKGWCNGPVSIVGNSTEIAAFSAKCNKRICIVAQTTFNYNKFQELVEIFNEKMYDNNVVNTICNATEERQTEAKSIAEKVDAMIVVGDRHSSNTQKLYDICKKECKNTYYIQTPIDLESKPFQSFSHVGITAGASTPNNIIEEVQKNVRIKF